MKRNLIFGLVLGRLAVLKISENKRKYASFESSCLCLYEQNKWIDFLLIERLIYNDFGSGNKRACVRPLKSWKCLSKCQSVKLSKINSWKSLWLIAGKKVSHIIMTVLTSSTYILQKLFDFLLLFLDACYLLTQNRGSSAYFLRYS